MRTAAARRTAYQLGVARRRIRELEAELKEAKRQVEKIEASLEKLYRINRERRSVMSHLQSECEVVQYMLATGALNGATAPAVARELTDRLDKIKGTVSQRLGRISAYAEYADQAIM